MPECHLKNETCGGRCTGFDGKFAWENRRKAINKDIDCDSCNKESHKLETFNHDIVNGRLGKQIFDKKNFHEFVDIVNCVSNKCKKDGRC